MDISNVIIEYITIENYENYPFLSPEYIEMLKKGLIQSIKLERKIMPSIQYDEILKLEEYRLRRKQRRQKQRREAREFKRKALITEFEEDS